VDVDLKDIIEYMQTTMADEKPKCELERVILDLSDREARLELFQRLGAKGKKTLVVTEGLIVYLKEEEAGALAFDLSHTANFNKWVVDIISPGILPLIKNEMGKMLDDAKTPLVFAPEEGEDFFRIFGWKPVVSKSKLKTAATLKRLSEEMMTFAAIPEPPGPKGNFPWSGVCLFENSNM
jgi:O-methyltransferase involved in polyketide biosynthesis